jgi:hypothetical protein
MLTLKSEHFHPELAKVQNQQIGSFQLYFRKVVVGGISIAKVTCVEELRAHEEGGALEIRAHTEPYEEALKGFPAFHHTLKRPCAAYSQAAHFELAKVSRGHEERGNRAGSRIIHVALRAAYSSRQDYDRPEVASASFVRRPRK